MKVERKISQENGPKAEKDKTESEKLRKSNRTRQKNKIYMNIYNRQV